MGVKFYMDFKLIADFKPTGDQPEAIKKLVDGYLNHSRQTLLGITGSGKTFTMSNIIASLNKPTLVLAHNKTLAAQLYNEFKTFFPNNAVEYFVSFYDYYQPESYLPQTDTYIEKDSKINEKIEQLRLRATAALMTRKDVIIVSSVSCIYSLGSPKNFEGLALNLNLGQKIDRQEILKKLLNIQYERNDTELKQGNFRVRGSTIDLVQGFEDDITRIILEDDKIVKIEILDHVTLDIIEGPPYVLIFPARHYIIEPSALFDAISSIREELKQRLKELPELESQRLKQRTNYDLEMIEQMGYCNGIENYSRHFDKRKPGEPPYCLLDFFPKDFLLFIDESHQTIPQVHGMYHGDYTRKKALIDFGFRLPSAFDNRPLKFQEFEKYLNHVIFVSATPSEYETKGSGQVVEQIIRPTGLLDPEIFIRKTKSQIEDLIKEINFTVKDGNRVLVTTLTKRMAEELADFLAKNNIKVRYLHSEIDTLERTEIIRELRLGVFDVLVGINLLREGLDIPEVSLVAILDADKEGFLRNTRSLIQTIGRAARNDKGRVIMYADTVTQSIKEAYDITTNRRKKQIQYNKVNDITPKTIIKPIKEKQVDIKDTKHIPRSDIPNLIIELEAKMKIAAEELNFEAAIRLRDKVTELKKAINVTSDY